MFRRLFDNLFGKKSTAPQSSGMSAGSVDLFDTDIPRYPPFATGLPAAPVEKIIQTQNELIGRIQSTLGFRDEDFARYVLPVINRFAGFVHLLPASESHHHRGAGGLFRHGLEVAFWAAQASENMIFTMEGSPQERRDNIPRWRLACCFSGLLHDVGKPLHDVAVTDQRGEHKWNPYAESLIEWAERNDVSHYFLRWRDKRHKRHEQFSLLTIERIIAPEVWQYLSDPGPEMIEAMMEAVAGININQPVTKLTLKADQESVSRDIRNNRLNVDEFAYGVPVERYVFDAIRRLINTGRWKVNEAGAKVWVLPQGVFVTWKQIGELFELIDQDKTPGIPRDTDTLADILIERGYAIARTVSENGEEAIYRYWEVSPEIPTTGNISATASLKILMLRFESAELLFTSEPPAPVKGKVTGLNDEEYEFESLEEINDSDATSAGAAEIAVPGVDVPVMSVADSLHKSVLVEEPENGNIQENNVPVEQSRRSISDISPINTGSIDAEFKVKKKPLIVDLSNENKSQPTSSSSEKPESSANKGSATDPLIAGTALLNQIGMDSGLSILAGLMGDEADINVGNEQRNEQVGSERNETVKKETVPAKSNQITTGETVTSQSQPEEETSLDPKAESLAQLSQVLSKYNEAKPLLEKTLMAVVNRESLMGENICFLKNKLAILHPKGLESMGELQEVMTTLSNSGAVEADPEFPGKKVQAINGIKAVILTRDISTTFKVVLDAAEDFCEAETLIVPSVQAKANNSASGANRSEAKAKKRNAAKKSANAVGSTVEAGGQKRESSQKKEMTSGTQGKKSEPQSTVHKTFVRKESPLAELQKQSENTSSNVSNVEDKPCSSDTYVQNEQSSETENVTSKKCKKKDQEESGQEVPTPVEALNMLKVMIANRKGRWLVGPVTEKEGRLYTSIKAFDRISDEYLSISPVSLRYIVNATLQQGRRLSRSQDMLILEPENEN